MFASLGAYAANGSPFDLWLLLLVGGLGFAMRRYGLPVVPLIVGLILAPRAEKTDWQPPEHAPALSRRRAWIPRRGALGLLAVVAISTSVAVAMIVRDGGTAGWDGLAAAQDATGIDYDLTITPVNGPTKDDCRNGGWEQYGFTNQGVCVSSVVSR